MTVLRVAVLVLFASEDDSKSPVAIASALADEIAGRHRLQRISQESGSYWAPISNGPCSRADPMFVARRIVYDHSPRIVR